MAEVDILEQTTNADVAVARDIDLLIAIPACADRDKLSPLMTRISQALKQFSTPYSAKIALPTEMAAVYEESVMPHVEEQRSNPLTYMGFEIPTFDTATLPWLRQALTTETLLTLADQTHARACTVLGSEVCDMREALSVERLNLLLEPCMEGSLDLVMPQYAAQAYDDLLNKAILYPLTRALYGRRIRYPLANEFQASSKLIQNMRGRAENNSPLQKGRLLWLASAAAIANLKICQVNLGTLKPQIYDGVELNDALAQMAGGLFLDMEDNAVAWQRVRGSMEVPTFGASEAAPETSKPMDVGRLVETFQLGVRNLHEIWSLILPPATLLELKRILLLAAEDFHIPDGLWARIVYDFALAHRLRNVHRTHLFGAFKPLYLGWVASYVNDISRAGLAAAEDRIEELARSFEAEKPYLVSRWRWPDRFHP